jgi:hypothetical protein
MIAARGKHPGLARPNSALRFRQAVWIVLPPFLLLFALVSAWPQTPPSVGFALDFPGSIPDDYMIVVFADGRATYDSTGKLTADGETPDPFHLDFQFTPETKTKVFDLTARAKYFDGKVDSGKKNLASTGDKTLIYQDGQRKTAHYNYSPNPAVQELTAIFQNTSTTLEFGRRLAYFQQYQKLALDDELKRMDEMNRSGEMAQLQAIAPILKQIIADQSVINVSRARAQRLLARAGAR